MNAYVIVVGFMVVGIGLSYVVEHINDRRGRKL